MISVISWVIAPWRVRMVSSFLGNTGRAACLPGVAENEENDEDFANVRWIRGKKPQESFVDSKDF